jgi:dihydroorotase
MTGLETAYAVVNHLLPELNSGQLAKLFSLNARNIFNLPSVTIAEGAIAELSLFTGNGTTSVNRQTIKSRSLNTAFIDRELKGSVIGIVNKGNLFLNQTI